jgi:quercetin dioxygenase-like cupin family protein
MRISRTCVALVALVAASMYGGEALATPQSGVTTSFIASQFTMGPIDINAHGLPDDDWQTHVLTKGTSDAYIVDNVFQPGGTSGWHSHPGPSLIFVVRGSITEFTSDDPACAGIVHPSGTVFVDEGGTHAHMLENDGAVPAETVAVQLLPQGAKRRIDADAPPACTH